MPQSGLTAADVSPVALPDTPVQSARSRALWTPRSWARKSGMKGKQKAKPKMAVNCAKKRITRLRRQSTTAVGGGTSALRRERLGKRTAPARQTACAWRCRWSKARKKDTKSGEVEAAG